MAGVEEVRSVGAVRPIGWEGSRSEREGTRVRGEGGAAGRQQGRPPKARSPFFSESTKLVHRQTDAEFLGFRAEVPQEVPRTKVQGLHTPGAVTTRVG